MQKIAKTQPLAQNSEMFRKQCYLTKYVNLT